MDTLTRRQILEKCKKLHSLANCPAGNPNEKAAAQARLMNMLFKYQLTHDEIAEIQGRDSARASYSPSRSGQGNSSSSSSPPPPNYSQRKRTRQSGKRISAGEYVYYSRNGQGPILVLRIEIFNKVPCWIATQQGKRIVDPCGEKVLCVEELENKRFI